jgi:hypothetical protein
VPYEGLDHASPVVFASVPAIVGWRLESWANQARQWDSVGAVAVLAVGLEGVHADAWRP